jgi:hypothetical protein
LKKLEHQGAKSPILVAQIQLVCFCDDVWSNFSVSEKSRQGTTRSAWRGRRRFRGGKWTPWFIAVTFHIDFFVSQMLFSVEIVDFFWSSSCGFLIFVDVSSLSIPLNVLRSSWYWLRSGGRCLDFGLRFRS